MHLEDPCDIVQPDYFKRSIFGLISIYNLLPEFVIACSSVKVFQSKLQVILKFLATGNYDSWNKVYHRDTILTSILPSITLAALKEFENCGIADLSGLHVTRLSSR